jgi:ATPase family associated with various cellular activities (AAA)
VNLQADPRTLLVDAAYVAPFSRRRNELHVPDAFFAAVCSHLRGNYSRNMKIPRLLGVQGPAGEGKTEMVSLVCSQVGCNTFCIASAALSGKHEGDASNLLLHLCREARSVALSNDRPSVLILDDIDRSIAARRQDTSQTINSELLVGALQGLANDLQDRSGDTFYSRCPIVLTGNDFSCLPETLTRPGRMQLFAWEPTWEDKAVMVLPLFGARSWFEVQRLRKLVRTYHRKGEPVAFFVELVSRYQAAAAGGLTDCDDILEAVRTYDTASHDALQSLDFTRLSRMAADIHRNKPRSFLRKKG